MADAAVLTPPGVPKTVIISEGHPYFTTIDRTMKKSQAGPGMFVSRRNKETGELRLYAALVPVTRVSRDPENEERTIDVPLVDEQGRTLMQLDPAARTTIWLMNDGNDASDSMPTTPFPDSKDAMASGLETLGRIIVEQNAAAEKRFELLIAALTAKK